MRLTPGPTPSPSPGREAGLSPTFVEAPEPRVEAVLLAVAASGGAALLPAAVTQRYAAPGVRLVELTGVEPAFETAVLTRPEPDGLATHGFLRDSSGAFTTIDVPGATVTGFSGINDRGQMIGAYVDANGTPHAFLLDNGVVTIIDVPNASITVPFGINNHGQIVGTYTDNTGTYAFLLNNGAFTTINPPGALVQFAVAFDIDDRGRIVGGY